MRLAASGAAGAKTGKVTPAAGAGAIAAAEAVANEPLPFIDRRVGHAVVLRSAWRRGAAHSACFADGAERASRARRPPQGRALSAGLRINVAGSRIPASRLVAQYLPLSVQGSRAHHGHAFDRSSRSVEIFNRQSSDSGAESLGEQAPNAVWQV
jgi:hypothetical protein